MIGDAYGGVGFFIFEGYRHGFPTEILAGAVPSIGLAIALDVVLVSVQRLLTPWARMRDAAGAGQAVADVQAATP
jgi:osmoprotectant transport system permease protein